MNLKELDTKKILRSALGNGGDYSDIYYERSLVTQIFAEEGRVEKVTGGLDEGVGIGVTFGEKSAYGHTTEISQKGLEGLAETVASAVNAEKFSGDIRIREIPPERTFEIKKAPDKYRLQEKIRIVKSANDAAWKISKKIRQVKVSYGDLSKSVQIANSLGELVEDKRIYTVFYVQVVAADGDIVQTGYHPIGGLVGLELFDETGPEIVAERAAKQAMLMLGARRAPGGVIPVVISSEAGGTMIHEAVGHGLEADLACEGLSVYHKKLGERIASEKITVIDDATIPGRRGSFLFDDEGVPAKKTILIEKGVLKSYMFNRLYAQKEGVASTGNGRRESFRSKPICRMTNTLIAPGSDDPAGIVRNTERGLFVKKMGGGQVNTINGDFVFEVTEGYLIEKGKIGEPLRGATLIGNGPRVIKIIDRVGSDLGFSIGTCGKDDQGVPVGDAQPTIRIPELTVGGAASH